MTDKVLMTNYLMILKSTVEVYVHGTLESSNDSIRMLLKKCLDETLSCQANTYEEMTRCGWYTIENVDASVVQKTLDKVNSDCK